MHPRYTSQIQRCENQIRNFIDEVLSEAHKDLTSRAIPEKWSAHENLAHLARYHEIFLERVERILSEDKPIFARYRAEEDPDWELWRQRPLRDLLERLVKLRLHLALKLKSLSDQDFRRIGVHPRFEI